MKTTNLTTHMKRALEPTLLSASLLLGLASCSKDTVEVDPYERWAERNAAYLDSVIQVAANPPAGETWRTHLSYKIKSENLGEDIAAKEDYVYVKVLQEGRADGVTPLSTDTVYTAYKGYLMNGTLFDSSYSGDFDPKFTEATFSTQASAVVTGWTTTLLYMKEGERVEVFIPYKLGYGTSDYSSIPGYSVMRFDMYLDKVVHPQGPEK